MNTFVVGIDNGSKALLSCSVPDLHFDYFLIDVDRLEPKVDSDGDHVVFVEVVICKAQE